MNDKRGSIKKEWTRTKKESYRYVIRKRQVRRKDEVRKIPIVLWTQELESG